MGKLTTQEAIRRLKENDFTPLNDLVYRVGRTSLPPLNMYIGPSPEECWAVIERRLRLLDAIERNAHQPEMQYEPGQYTLKMEIVAHKYENSKEGAWLPRVSEDFDRLTNHFYYQEDENED